MNPRVLLRWSLVFFLILMLNCDAAKMISIRNLISIKAQRMIHDRGIDLAVVEQIDPHLALTDSSIRRMLAQLYVSANHPDVAIELLLGDAQTCTSILNCFYLGEALYRIGEREKALSIWRKVKDVDVYFALKGDISYTRDGGKEEAARYYALSWEISASPTKQKKTMLLNLCRDSRSKGEQQIAVSWCQNAAVVSRDYWTLVELGRTFFEAADYLSAEEVLVEAKTSNPSLGAAYQYLGLTQHRLGKKRESIEALATSVRLMPDSVWPRIIFADVLSTYGCYKQAINQYGKALELAEQGALYETIEAKKHQLEEKSSLNHLPDDECRFD